MPPSTPVALVDSGEIDLILVYGVCQRLLGVFFASIPTMPYTLIFELHV